MFPDGIKPLAKYENIIESFREPRTIEEIQSVLGLVNYVGKWIPNLATLTRPIREVLRLKLGKTSDISTYWKDEQTEALNSFKKELANIKTLGYYDHNDRTRIVAVASPIGLGAVPIQYDKEGPRITAYASKSLTVCEKHYCTD